VQDAELHESKLLVERMRRRTPRKKDLRARQPRQSRRHDESDTNGARMNIAKRMRRRIHCDIGLGRGQRSRMGAVVTMRAIPVGLEWI
jgi:hypothetical protein